MSRKYFTFQTFINKVDKKLIDLESCNLFNNLIMAIIARIAWISFKHSLIELVKNHLYRVIMFECRVTHKV